MLTVSERQEDFELDQREGPGRRKDRFLSYVCNMNTVPRGE